MTDRQTSIKAAVGSTGLNRDHEICLTITCADEDWQMLLHTITQVIADRYRAVMVRGTFAVHNDEKDMYRWTWQTKEG